MIPIATAPTSRRFSGAILVLVPGRVSSGMVEGASGAGVAFMEGADSKSDDRDDAAPLAVGEVGRGTAAEICSTVAGE